MAENYTILVCDDEKEITEAIEIYLTQEGYRVLKAYDGSQAIGLLEKNSRKKQSSTPGGTALFRPLSFPKAICRSRSSFVVMT